MTVNMVDNERKPFASIGELAYFVTTNPKNAKYISEADLELVNKLIRIPNYSFWRIFSIMSYRVEKRIKTDEECLKYAMNNYK